MKVPKGIIGQIYDHYQTSNWCLIILDQDNNIVYNNSNAAENFNLDNNPQPVQELIPLLAAETLDEAFMLPFFNHQDNIYDVHFLLDEQYKYIIMVPIDMHHQQVQFKQQMAHEEVIEKLKLQSLFSTLQNAHEELKEANSAKSFYISALSHEIGNPINAIKGYNELMMEGAIAPEDATKVIRKNIDKIQQIITQTLDYDQQYNTQYSTKLKPAEMIDELFQDFRVQAQSKKLKLINQVDPTIVINTNKTKWNQIFTNLISNAIKYTDEGSITISSIVENDLLHIDTIDTGCGMSQNFQEKLFTAWNREMKSQSQGNGIGLVISKMLAEQLGADLILHSSNTQGSRFRFSVNYFKPMDSRDILLVDDDWDCLNLFNYYLSQAGYQVKTADSLTTIKKQLRDHSFDCVISDLNLSDGRVDEIYDLIRAKVEKIIVTTANPTPEQRLTLEQMGFDQVLAKPLNQDTLVNSVL